MLGLFSLGINMHLYSYCLLITWGDWIATKFFRDGSALTVEVWFGLEWNLSMSKKHGCKCYKSHFSAESKAKLPFSAWELLMGLSILYLCINPQSCFSLGLACNSNNMQNPYVFIRVPLGRLISQSQSWEQLRTHNPNPNPILTSNLPLDSYPWTIIATCIGIWATKSLGLLARVLLYSPF